jgi:N-acetylglutamate synthase-like GNAT family acetyltransferase
MIALRSFELSDFDLLLDLANQAVPFAPHENSDWLAARKAFDESRAARRHYIAYDLSDANALGYGCLEQQEESVYSLRIYVVCSPERLAGEVGEKLFTQLLGDAAALGASHLWARELVGDEPIRQFFLNHRFRETRHITTPAYPRMGLFERSLRETW